MRVGTPCVATSLCGLGPFKYTYEPLALMRRAARLRAWSSGLGLAMIKLTTVLLAAGVVVPTATTATAQEPTSLLCQGKAASPLLGTTDRAVRLFGAVSLSATLNYDRTLEVVLEDDTGRRELPGSVETRLGKITLGVVVRTGSLTVEKEQSKVVLKMLWQKAGMSEDFMGFAVGQGFTSVLQVDSFDHGKAPKGTQMPFNFFDGMDTILYKGTCAAR
jgi:hypothetical protein